MNLYQNDFLHAGTNSCKLKERQKFRGWCGQKWIWPVEWWDSKIDSIWRMNKWNNLIFGMLMQIYWMGMVKNGCGQSGHGTLKLTVSQNWTDEITWFFACYYKCRKAESWFNHFWVCLVKDGSGFLIHEMLKPAS